jgi:hypothetical protein
MKMPLLYEGKFQLESHRIRVVTLEINTTKYAYECQRSLFDLGEYGTCPVVYSSRISRFDDLSSLLDQSSLLGYLSVLGVASETLRGASLYDMPWIACLAACACSAVLKSTKQKLRRPSPSSRGLTLLLTPSLIFKSVGPNYLMRGWGLIRTPQSP